MATSKKIKYVKYEEFTKQAEKAIDVYRETYMSLCSECDKNGIRKKPPVLLMEYWRYPKKAQKRTFPISFELDLQPLGRIVVTAVLQGIQYPPLLWRLFHFDCYTDVNAVIKYRLRFDTEEDVLYEEEREVCTLGSIDDFIKNGLYNATSFAHKYYSSYYLEHVPKNQQDKIEDTVVVRKY